MSKSHDKAKTVCDERISTYGDPQDSMRNLGLAITFILQDHYQMVLPHIVPPHVTAAILVALKLGRSVRPFDRKDNDDFVDAHNYLDFAEAGCPTIPKPEDSIHHA